MSNGSLLYETIAEQIAGEIVNGELAVGEPVPSVRVLCQRFEVSHITILHVLQLLLTKDLIERHGRGYRVCRQFPGLGGTDSSLLLELPVGLYLRPYRVHSEDNYFNEINTAIEQELCLARKYYLRGFGSGEFNYKACFSPEECQEILRNLCLLDGRCCGLLIDERVPDVVLERFLVQRHRPMVLVNRPTSLPISSVSIPMDRVAALLWSKCHQLGYCHIVLCNSPCALYPNDCLFYESCKELSASPHGRGLCFHSIRCDQISDESLLWQARGLYASLSVSGRVLFVFSSNAMVLRFSEFMGEHGLSSGRDYGLCGFYLSSGDSSSQKRLSTLKIDTAQMGRVAVQLLLHACSQACKEVIEHEACEVEFVLGDST